MKKMMIIAVLISGMLMPAQIFAKNDRREVKKENRVSVDYNRANKGGNVAKNHKNEPKKPVVVKHHNPAPVVVHHHKPAPVVVHHHKPAHVVHHCTPPVVVHHHKPAHVVHHCPPPPPVVHHHHCNDGVAEAAAVVVGLAGLISILAN
jgi:16S rRNA U516 pseudouridylate synthase RsuA-like enzyme